MQKSRFLIITIGLLFLSVGILSWQLLSYRVPDYVKNPPSQEELKLKALQNELRLEKPLSRATDPVIGNPQAALAVLHVPVHISAEYARTPSVGCRLALVARCLPARDLAPAPPSVDPSATVPACVLGADALGRRGIAAEEVGEACGKRLAQLVAAGFPVDPHHADMLIPYMALAPGSEVATLDISEHLRSNIYVAEKFFQVRFSVEGHTVKSQERS